MLHENGSCSGLVNDLDMDTTMLLTPVAVFIQTAQ